MGDDTAIVQAARISYNSGTKGAEKDEKLIRFLMENDHTSPFEQVEFKFHIRMPMFIARQWIRHRTANANEISGRYTIIEEDYYMPPASRLNKQSKTNKQQSADECITEAEYAMSLIENSSEQSFETYKKLLKTGLAKEVARIILPLNTMTEFYWKNDLHNTLKFLKLRLAPNAQKEIQDLATELAHHVKRIVPVTWKAWCELEYMTAKIGYHDWLIPEKMAKIQRLTHTKYEFLKQRGLL